MRILALGCMILAATGCVRAEDLEAWVGQPVAALETHPVFSTVPVVRTRASDGTEIWNYVNGREVTNCEQSVRGSGGHASYATYSRVTNCTSGVMACNNIFYVRNGIVLRYTPIGTGGAICYTDSRMQPHFYGSTNIK